MTSLQDKIDAMGAYSYSPKEFTKDNVNKAIQELREQIQNLDTLSEESDAFDSGHHLAIKEILALIGKPKE